MQNVCVLDMYDVCMPCAMQCRKAEFSKLSPPMTPRLHISESRQPASASGRRHLRDGHRRLLHPRVRRPRRVLVAPRLLQRRRGRQRRRRNRARRAADLSHLCLSQDEPQDISLYRQVCKMFVQYM